jgi:hypothetical protein
MKMCENHLFNMVPDTMNSSAFDRLHRSENLEIGGSDLIGCLGPWVPVAV